MTYTHEKPWGSIHAVRAKGFKFRRPSRVPYRHRFFFWLVVQFHHLENDGVKVNGVGMTSHAIYEMKNNP